MRQLTLFRHAHAERPSEEQEDFERALDKRGRREAKHMARHLAQLHWRPDHLITSPAVRTVQTAKALAGELDFELARIRHDDRVYLAEADTLLAILHSVPAGVRHVLLVGHNPGLSTLAGRLSAGEEPGELATAAAYSLRFALDDWRSLDWRTGRRALFVAPSQLEDED